MTYPAHQNIDDRNARVFCFSNVTTAVILSLRYHIDKTTVNSNKGQVAIKTVADTGLPQ